MAHLYISAAHKSSGKTVCTLAIAPALRQQGHNLQTFKKGPDYIDPLWLSRAVQRDCHNLDFHTMSDVEIQQLFARYDETADLSLIEGNKGLHDSVDVQGKFSNAALANLLGAPVVLVMDTRGMTRGIAALLRGLVEFDPAVNFAGVILNHVGGERHEAKLRTAIEHYTDLRVLGVMPSHDALLIPEAHLGLVPTNENAKSQQMIEAMARVAKEHVDLAEIMRADARAKCPALAEPYTNKHAPQNSVRIGVARDEAFGFYYPGDLTSLEDVGAPNW